MRRILGMGFLATIASGAVLAAQTSYPLLAFGILPLALGWKRIDWARVGSGLVRGGILLAVFLCYSIGALWLHTGLQPGQEPPVNPDLEQFAIAGLMFLVGLLRAAQLDDPWRLYHSVIPWALAVVIVVLAVRSLSVSDGSCRATAVGASPFVPALVVSTLSMLLLKGWAGHNRRARSVRYLFIGLSVFVAVGLTQARGITLALAATLALLALVSRLDREKHGLPAPGMIMAAALAGVAFVWLFEVLSGCTMLSRMGVLLDAFFSVIGRSFEAQASGLQGAMGTIAVVAQDSLTALAPYTEVIADVGIRERIEILEAGFAAFLDAPVFGNGLLYQKVIVTDVFGYEHVHNQYLSWLVTGGLVGLVIGLGLVAAPLFATKWYSTQDSVVIGLATTGIWSASMLFDSYLSMDFPLHFFCLLLGFLSATRANRQEGWSD